MGVQGLWQIVQPCARPTNLAQLNRRRLAVDASIWIYQFLKAVRDKEGNALRSSHIVGFFRRICKLLWFGIQPVFVFDGGAPILKRLTIQGRKKRREGRREDATRTAGKLLAVQLQRAAEEEIEGRRKRAQELAPAVPEEVPEEPIPSADQLVYVDEIGMSQQERQRSRKFRKEDTYHLPDLDGGGIAAMGRSEDPRIMTPAELEEYARQFHAGEDVKLYDFSKIDFDGDFFQNLPPADRYNILNAARLRSRLRMGLSKEQLEVMFPDRMAFSRFQIERVRERNQLTQRLMRELGMSSTDLTVGGRVVGEKDREYILVKNEGAEGGWALGVVRRDKEAGQQHKPIDVDALYPTANGAKDEGGGGGDDDDDDDDDDDEFEDVPIEGVNRLPRLSGRPGKEKEEEEEEEDGLFVPGSGPDPWIDKSARGPPPGYANPFTSPRKDYPLGTSTGLRGVKDVDSEDAPPEWEQKSVQAPRPIPKTSGQALAHLVNNRSNAAAPHRPMRDAVDLGGGGDSGSDSDSDSDSDLDLYAAMRKSNLQPRPTTLSGPLDGPLPFPRLGLTLVRDEPVLSGSRPAVPAFPCSEPKPATATQPTRQPLLPGPEESEENENSLAGGFEKEPSADDAPRPLPPWLVDDGVDIRESLQRAREAENRAAAEDRAAALEEDRAWERIRNILVVAGSDDDDDDVEILDAPPEKPAAGDTTPTREDTEVEKPPLAAEGEFREELEDSLTTLAATNGSTPEPGAEDEFEDVPMPAPTGIASARVTRQPEQPELPTWSNTDETHLDIAGETPTGLAPGDFTTTPPRRPNEQNHDPHFDAPEDEDDYSDPEDAELLVHMAEEVEEHARFAGELNRQQGAGAREAYQAELKALRTQKRKDLRDSDEVTQVMVSECQTLLRLFGIPYITAPMEAEAQCAELVRLGLVDGIVTDDSDTFLFGGTRVYKNMFNDRKFVECYVAADLEKELSLSREQLIALAHLLGSDYTEGLRGVGPVTAVEILSEFPGPDGLARFREWMEDIQLRQRPKEADAGSAFRRKFRRAHGTKLFLPAGFPSGAVAQAYLHPEVDHGTEPFQWGVPDVEGLRRFLMGTVGWDQERTDEVLVPVVRDMNRREREGTQTNITRYFGGGVGVGARAAAAGQQQQQQEFGARVRAAGRSKRMANAVERLKGGKSKRQRLGEEEGD